MSLAGEPHLVSALPLDPYEVIEDQNDPTGANQQNEEETKQWDVFGLSSDEWKDNYRTSEFKFFTKLLKIAVYLITFCIVLGSAVVSKSSLLLMTTAINAENKFPICGNYIKDADRPNNIVVINDRRTWIWCLLIALFMPEVFTFLKSARICFFKKFRIPRLKTLLLVTFAESLHVIGIVLMLFLVFPQVNFLEALTLTNAVCIVPALLNFLSNWPTEGSWKSARKSVFDLIVLILQFSVIFLYIAYAIIKKDLNTKEKFVLWASPISCLLISCVWWENFTNANSKIFNKLKDVKDDIEESRHFLYTIIPFWKIALVLASCVAVRRPLDPEVIHNLFTRFNDTFTKSAISIDLPEKHDMEVGNYTTWPQIFPPSEEWNRFFPVLVICVHIVSSYLCYICGKFVCKICIQGFSYALPVVLTVPATMCLLFLACGIRAERDCNKYPHLLGILPYLLWKCPENSLKDLCRGGFTWIFWIMSQTWLTHYIWISKRKRMASTNELFVNPLYCTALIDQSLAFNRRKEQEIDELLETVEDEAMAINREKSIPQILACATMWHETPDEMELLLKSIMRMDNDYCIRKTIKEGLRGDVNNDFYEVETHIFFDDAFDISDDDDTKMVINSFVKDLIVSVDKAASKIYPPDIKFAPPVKVPTPYGGRLIWRLPGNTLLFAHLKNKDLIRHKKRWSQVMYMYYLLGYRLMNPDTPSTVRDELAKNTFILALDGDIDFKPDAVQLLVDLMKRNENLGAACGRIHPVGTGMMVYYQKFEYAIGHWLQKATEHMIGCVLCSPGCFSLFRAEALMQDNVVRRYATKSREAIEFVQFDQGEDRWLCTLLLQSGSRVEYSAASDAYTHCPESFAEFYTQRRRWAPSTMANIMDLLLNYKKTVDRNDNISLLYIIYQLMMMVGTILGPGTIFLMLVGAMVSAFGISNWQSLIANFIPVAFFILICFLAKNDTQILVAQIFSAAYALLMMAVIVGISLQMVVDGIASPSAIFLLAMTASFVVAAILHPREFSCVFHGIIYFLSVPSMYLFLTLYSITNLHVVSWGTREVATKKTKKQLEQEKLEAAKKQKSGISDWFGFLNDKRFNEEEEEGSITFGLANLFRCMCCTYPKPDSTKLPLVKIGEQLENLQRQINFKATRSSGFRRRSSMQGRPIESNLITVPENDDDGEDDSAEDEIDGETHEHVHRQASNSNSNTDEYWLTADKEVLKNSPTWRMLPREESFWKELIERYLKPLEDNPQEKAKAAAQLIDLRNKVVFGILMLNSLFILIVFLLQMQKDILHIEWPFNGKVTSIIYIQASDELVIQLEFLQLEPINLILVFFFSIIVVIQFIAMMFHRFQTISHILASTELSISKDSPKPNVIMSELTDVLVQLNHRPDDVTDGQRDLPNRRRSTVCNLELNRQGKNRQVRSLSVAYEETLKGLVQNDFQTVNRARRLSKNPSLLGAVRRFSVSQSTATTPQTSPRSRRGGNRRLGSAVSSSVKSNASYSYRNQAFDGSLGDSESLTASVSRSQLTVPDTIPKQLIQAKVVTPWGSLTSLRSIDETDEC